MSALPPKADMDQHGRDVRFVPKADIQSVRFRHIRSRKSKLHLRLIATYRTGLAGLPQSIASGSLRSIHTRLPRAQRDQGW